MSPLNMLDHLAAIGGINLDFFFLLFGSNLHYKQLVDCILLLKKYPSLAIYMVPTQVLCEGLLLSLLSYTVKTKKLCSLLSLGRIQYKFMAKKPYQLILKFLLRIYSNQS